jgi:hypothetical protein
MSTYVQQQAETGSSSRASQVIKAQGLCANQKAPSAINKRLTQLTKEVLWSQTFKELNDTPVALYY